MYNVFFFSGFEPFGEHKVNASWIAVQVRALSKSLLVNQKCYKVQYILHLSQTAA